MPVTGAPRGRTFRGGETRRPGIARLGGGREGCPRTDFR
ncbi:Uncharacterised protein [Amycolatopsis camponoti]|uniref:Uncharacterized protein n=1 Tax=Amycolatopsis camponoti TaxID=2606593 RepID=A0A6I8LPH0_9PSEU|nr:Uncharacterised protein [Amycolatopsis camponoti]